MKQVFHKIASIIMAFVVLFSTMSFSIGMHYCGNTLVDSALFHKAKDCGMEMQKGIIACNKTVVNNDCCHDEQIKVKGQNELKISFNNLKFHQQVFIASFVFSYINQFTDLKENITTFDEYPPPLIVKNIYKLDEVYLI